MNLLKWEINVKSEILIWHMLSEMVKKWSRTGFYISYNYFCTLYFENYFS